MPQLENPKSSSPAALTAPSDSPQLTATCPYRKLHPVNYLGFYELLNLLRSSTQNRRIGNDK